MATAETAETALLAVLEAAVVLAASVVPEWPAMAVAAAGTVAPAVGVASCSVSAVTAAGCAGRCGRTRTQRRPGRCRAQRGLRLARSPAPSAVGGPFSAVWQCNPAQSQKGLSCCPRRARGGDQRKQNGAGV
ncbi:hypothetical protein B1T45_18680 [Mycobacterium kansasii]|nr:hypothetical protein B1T45_18680 [Mycobacterium kansasii]